MVVSADVRQFGVRSYHDDAWLAAAVADNNPISATVNALRALLLGGPITAVVAQSLTWIVVIVIVFSTLAIRQYCRIE